MIVMSDECMQCPFNGMERMIRCGSCFKSKVS